jgi:hypothetical protein
MLFYRHKGTVYNTCLMGIYTLSMSKASHGRLTSSLHLKTHIFGGARRRARSGKATTWSLGCRGHANLYPCIDERPWT